MYRSFDSNSNQKEEFYLGLCKLDKNQTKIALNNPHCTEFFCNLNNVISCTSCTNHLIKHKNIKLFNPKEKDKAKDQDLDTCTNKNQCANGYVYDYVTTSNLESINSNDKSEIDKYKLMKDFYNTNFIYKLIDVPYLVNYELTAPKPKTIVHWGQLKMFLVTLLFLLKKVNPNEKEVHVIYPGSGRGPINLLIILDMFPNTKWYLIDPEDLLPKIKSKLTNHKQIIEIRQEFFTDEIAKEYYEKFKNRDFPLLFFSDIRLTTDDEAILEDNDSNITWHKIIQPDYSYFKFRIDYEGDSNLYKYYKGDIYVQAYAPSSSTESRILFKKELVECTYKKDEYEGKFLYFNRILRPSYYRKAIIKNNNYFDHCYDCTYYSYLIKNYLNKFKSFNPFKTNDILSIMKNINKRFTLISSNKLGVYNATIRKNILNN